MAYSAGFTPHPKVSYANAAPTGVGSEAEYLEIALTDEREPEKLRILLNESLPTGLDVIDAVEVRTSGFADRLQASEWLLRLDGVTPGPARDAVAAFLAADAVEVERMTKNGVRTFDARGAVARLEVTDVADARVDTGTGSGFGQGDSRPGPGACAILRLVVRHVTPAVRPDDVLSGLRSTADFAPPVPAAVTRLAQGLLDEETGTVTDPFAPDRDAATVPEGSA